MYTARMRALSGQKVLFLITKSNWGGAQQYVYTLATAAAARGAEVAVALGSEGAPDESAGRLAARLAEAHVRTIFIRALARDMALARELIAFREILAIIRREHPDVLHLNSSKAGGIGALAGRLARVPRILFTAHGWPHQEPRGLISRVLIWWASYATVLFAHKTIVLSRSQARIAPAPFLRRRLVVIPTGVGAFPLRARADARAVLGALDARVRADARLILTASELHRNKGLDTLIDAFARIAPAHPDTLLALTHDGDERAALIARAARRGIRGRVIFLGFVPEARSLLAAADLFALPSRKEGLPYALLEAGYAGLPVVATRVGATSEVVEDGVSGLLVPSDNARALATGLARLLDDPALGARLGAALRERVIRDFSETRLLDATFALYTA